MSLKDEQERFRKTSFKNYLASYYPGYSERAVWSEQCERNYSKGFDAYESSPKYLKMIETLKEIRIRLACSSHTLMPINVRELDGSISQHRPPSNEGIAYNLASALLKEIGEAE